MRNYCRQLQYKKNTSNKQILLRRIQKNNTQENNTKEQVKHYAFDDRTDLQRDAKLYKSMISKS